MLSRHVSDVMVTCRRLGKAGNPLTLRKPVLLRLKTWSDVKAVLMAPFREPPDTALSSGCDQQHKMALRLRDDAMPTEIKMQYISRVFRAKLASGNTPLGQSSTQCDKTRWQHYSTFSRNSVMVLG
jgi:hypothetical protein